MGVDPSQKSVRPVPDDGTAEVGSAVLRADARDNRERLVAAALELFTARGIDVPLSAIARRAGVSAATLYRRFPGRDALVAEVFADQLAECDAVLARAVADEDPWRGLVRLLMTVSEMQARDRGFSAVFLARYPDPEDVEATRRRADLDVVDLVQRAKDTGDLRTDFEHTDVYLLLLAVDSLAAQPTEIAVAAARRLVAYVLQAARAGRTAPLPPSVPFELSVLHGDRAR